MYLSVYLSILYLTFVYKYVYLSLFSVYLSYVSVHVSVYTSSIYLSIFISIYLLSRYLSICLFLCLFMSIYVYEPVYLFIYLFFIFLSICANETAVCCLVPAKSWERGRSDFEAEPANASPLVTSTISSLSSESHLWKAHPRKRPDFVERPQAIRQSRRFFTHLMYP